MPRLGVGFLAAATALAFLPSHGAMAWGDEGHEVVALVAQAHLDPAVLKKVNALLAADTDDLTAHDIASEATWADKFRAGHRETAAWHFVDIELSNPNLDQACFGHPAVASGQPASKGPTDDCVVDKVQEFADELSNPNTAPEEQIVALKFLLHFVGDMHQPLHAADDNDRGGNQKKVSACRRSPMGCEEPGAATTPDPVGGGACLAIGGCYVDVAAETDDVAELQFLSQHLVELMIAEPTVGDNADLDLG